MITSLLSAKKIGILGFGATGKSILAFCTPYRPQQVFITQKDELTALQKELINGHQAQWVPYEHIAQFLEACDIIIPSPGVNLEPFQDYLFKMISELDLFSYRIKTPTIALTGSLGKTTTVTFLTELLNRLGKPALACGNIGYPLLDALAVQDQYEYLVLELSSFQLEHSQRFAPDYAALINLTENHLDRHRTLYDYAQAKGRLFKFQQPHQYTCMHLRDYELFWPCLGKQKTTFIHPDSYNDIIIPLSDKTAPENWRIIFTLLEFLGIPPAKVAPFAASLERPAHRMEHVVTHNGIVFYNDSKSTTPTATLQALSQIDSRPTLLFLGGVSKGINREPFCASLKNNSHIKHIFCFGKESQELFSYCQKAGIAASAHQNLEDAWQTCLTRMAPKDAILFSPAGASYDLFKDYQERGNAFKEQVNLLLTKNTPTLKHFTK